MDFSSIVVLFVQNMSRTCNVYIHTMYMYMFTVSPLICKSFYQEPINTIELIVSICTKHSELYIAQTTVGSICIIVKKSKIMKTADLVLKFLKFS